MAYDKKKLAKQAIDAIKAHNLFFMDDVFAFMPCSKATFYNHKLEQLDDIKELLEENKIKTKSALKSKWFKSDNATLQMALYKLLASETERKALAMEYHDHTSGGEKISINLIKGNGK